MTSRQSNVSRTPGAIEFGKLSLELRRRSYRDAEFASRYSIDSCDHLRSSHHLLGAPVAVRVSTNRFALAVRAYVSDSDLAPVARLALRGLRLG